MRSEVCSGEERLKSSSGKKRNDFVANPIKCNLIAFSMLVTFQYFVQIFDFLFLFLTTIYN